MKKNWKLILLLIIISVLYFICIGAGVSQSDDDSPSDNSEFGDQSVSEWMDENMPPWGKYFGFIPRPKLELEAADLVHTVSDSEAADRCDKAPLLTDPPRFSFQLAKACKTSITTSTSEDEYRDAKFDVSACTQGSQDATSILKVTYRTLNGEGEDLKEQVWPPDMKYDPNEAAFTILEHKGKLDFEYSGEKPCVVTLE